MKFINLTGAFLAVLGCCQAACGDFPWTTDPRASSSAARPVKWYGLATRLGRYHLDLPAEPERQESIMAGRPTYTATVKEPDRIYIFSEVEFTTRRASDISYPDIANRAAEVMANSFSGRMPVVCTHDSSRELTTNGLRGFEFTVQCGPTASSRVRFFDAGDRAFQLVVSGSPETVASKTAERFLGSLRPGANPVAQ